MTGGLRFLIGGRIDRLRGGRRCVRKDGKSPGEQMSEVTRMILLISQAVNFGLGELGLHSFYFEFYYERARKPNPLDPFDPPDPFDPFALLELPPKKWTGM